MTFQIDTGQPHKKSDPIELVPEWFRDIYNDDADPNRIIHDYGLHLTAALSNPVKLETCRNWTLREWFFLRHLAEAWPTIFDEYLVAYAERAAVIE